MFNAAYRKHLVVASLFVFWAMLSVLTIHSPVSIFPIPQEFAYTQATVSNAATDNPYLLPESGWQTTNLPDDWHKSRKGDQQHWYRIEFSSIPTSEKIWAVYLPSVTHNAEVFLNGEWIGRGGSFEAPVSRNQNKPLLFEFDSSLINMRTSIVEVRVKAASSEQGYLGPVLIGPADTLDSVTRWKTFMRVDLIQWTTIGMLLLSFVVFLFWMARQKDKIYLIFSLQLFIWSVHNLNLFISAIPVSSKLWESLMMVTLGWTVMLMLVFNHRYLGYKSIVLEKSLAIVAVIGCGIFFLPSIELVLKWGYTVWDCLLVIMGIYAIGFLVNVYWKEQVPDALLMLVVGIPMLVFGFHDILLVNHFIERSDGLIIQYSAIPAVVLFTWFLVRRFIESLNTAESLTATLEQRVKKRERQLEDQFERVQNLKNEQILSGERERIMRDMHDGIGGQLVSLATLLKDRKEPLLVQVHEKVHQSIIDLRMVIDSLDPVLSDIPTLLGTMRQRLVHLLEASNIKLDWQVGDLPESLAMSPKNSLHIMRIVQEAITNVIKHADSNCIRVATGILESERKAFIEIRDFGCGIQNNNDYSSRGLKNMEYRAQELQGELNVERVSGDESNTTGSSNDNVSGTRVRLLISL